MTQPLAQPRQDVQVMVVDDSVVIRGLISRTLADEDGIEVVTTAVNGQEAIEKLRDHQQVEAIVLDIEMPVMSGMEALPELLKVVPDVKIIMASTLTKRNADISLKAMELGATDYVPKPSISEKDSLPEFYKELTNKVRALGIATKYARYPELERRATPRTAGEVAAPIATAPVKSEYPSRKPKAIAIASSTGGPQALVKFFKGMQGVADDIPLFLTQHMPPTFTNLLAANITKQTGRKTKEAQHGDIAEAGVLYVAPGDYHMCPVRDGAGVKIVLNQEPQVNFCRPAADPMINALADIYGSELLVIVLTGMGYDGKDGGKYAKDKGATVIAQDKETSVVWGMPGAVAKEGVCSAVLPLDDIAGYVKKAEAR